MGLWTGLRAGGPHSLENPVEGLGFCSSTVLSVVGGTFQVPLHPPALSTMQGAPHCLVRAEQVVF